MVHIKAWSVSAARQCGFTLLELLLAIVVVATLTTIAVASYGSEMEKAKVSKAEADITSIEAAISLFEATNNRLPTSLGEVGLGSKLDPWGRPYHYLDFTGLRGKGQMRKDRNLVPLNSDYDLFSAGPDGAWLPPITAPVSQDDIIRADNGGFVGQASDF
jgi:general secretion pathway protein G